MAALVASACTPAIAEAATSGSAPVTAAAVSLAGTVAQGSFQSTALRDTVHYAVYTPRGYATSKTRYPVIYFLHGLPTTGAAYRSIRWVAHAVEQTGQQAIVIGAEGARDNEPDAEWLDRGPGHNWETATATELVKTVDSRYRTIPTRTGRAIIGVSAGGYGAASIGLHNPSTFSVIQSWSGYFRPTDPTGAYVINLGSRKANERADVHALVPRLHQQLGAFYGRTHFGFYVGSRDSRFRPDNERLNRELSASGFPHLAYGEYPGGHTADFWERHAKPWLALALSSLSRAR